MLNIITNYWPAFIICLAGIGIFITGFNAFLHLPSTAQQESIRQWAIYACAVAQASLGSGTGQLKMRATYDMFLEKFPQLAKIISFEKYQNIAESALLELKKMIETNPYVESVIKEGEV